MQRSKVLTRITESSSWFHTGQSKNQTISLRALSKCFSNSSGLVAMTASLGSLFQWDLACKNHLGSYSWSDLNTDLRNWIRQKKKEDQSLPLALVNFVVWWSVINFNLVHNLHFWMQYIERRLWCLPHCYVFTFPLPIFLIFLLPIP